MKQEKPEKDDTQNCGNHLKPLEDEDMAGTGPYVPWQRTLELVEVSANWAQVDKYYKGLPMENETNPDHLPAVNVKAAGVVIAGGLVGAVEHTWLVVGVCTVHIVICDKYLHTKGHLLGRFYFFVFSARSKYR